MTTPEHDAERAARLTPDLTLARAVAVHALAYPELHDQTGWIAADDTFTYGHAAGFNDETRNVPACPTTACLAGWTVALGHGRGGLVRTLIRFLRRGNSRTLWGVQSADAWTQAAAELLYPNADPARDFRRHTSPIRELRKIFLTTHVVDLYDMDDLGDSNYDDQVGALLDQRRGREAVDLAAIIRFCRLFGLDVDELRTEALRFRADHSLTDVQTIQTSPDSDGLGRNLYGIEPKPVDITAPIETDEFYGRSEH